ncbi:MAG: hypothetical protein G3M70_14310 [Candidatus Nitronauta litoralis]|uniref:CheW-like domain-containing protein n=1 Tax=Candidatus Nitronauta litoralis TaxID=2705533 RepID=A0A7T0BXX2_9BACT|nr:MAG: hypothetical protein G3M70_14310 [Candidatus Nitronauta litoralis]
MTTALQKLQIEGFQALVFRMHDTLFATDLEQIDELVEGDHWTHPDVEVFLLDRLMPLTASPLVYKDPHVITIHFQGNTVALQIDQPQDIAYIPIEAIRSFPFIVEKVRQHLWLWGISLEKKEPVLLIDCHKLAAGCLSQQEEVWN